MSGNRTYAWLVKVYQDLRSVYAVYFLSQMHLKSDQLLISAGDPATLEVKLVSLIPYPVYLTLHLVNLPLAFSHAIPLVSAILYEVLHHHLRLGLANQGCLLF